MNILTISIPHYLFHVFLFCILKVFKTCNYKKAELLNELESLGINKAKIYPEIDDVADYIKTHVNKTV